MSASPDEEKAAPIDLLELAEISGGDRSIEQQMLAVFRQANDADVAALKTALANRDLAAVTRCSHRIKGAGRMVGARALAGICEKIEQAGPAGDWDAIAAQGEALDRELDRIYASLGMLESL